MNKLHLYGGIILLLLGACQGSMQTDETEVDHFPFYEDENRFADLQVLEYELTGFDRLTTKQKELVYYLSQAALCGREITYAQNYKHNLQIKRSLEEIHRKFQGDRTTDNWKHFEVYLKRFWFSNGVHHHYAEKKFVPGFPAPYLDELINGTADPEWPLVNSSR